ncbi:MAG: Protein containing Lytic transglycosylase-like, catalytic domain [Microgenomates group bacterium Gr01-1014_16]|nr:MAG: Protein containing Lytic transglycosylase-like, catalytic domain [Microgenomates group bacterium Gr01-1014_16]
MTYKTPLILTTAVIVVFGLNHFKNGQVLAKKVEIVPTVTAPAVASGEGWAVTSTPTPTVTPKPTRIPTPTVKPQSAYTPEQIYNFIEEFGRQYGVDPNIIRHIAICESTFKPSVKNYIYAGLFQYDSRTWKIYRQKMGENPDLNLRYNAMEAVKTAAFTISKVGTHLWPNCQP